jgi:GAF domain-containing protein
MTDYSLLREQLASMTRTERDTIANLANASALLYMSLSDINWAGFYLVREGQLVLGPFQGKPACIRIDFGKGVCGNAAAGDAAILVPDVHAFPGHIACDAASRSEIVIPVHHAGRLTAVLDIDSPLRGRFTREDQEGLERFCAVLEDACDWRI